MGIKRHITVAALGISNCAARIIIEFHYVALLLIRSQLDSAHACFLRIGRLHLVI